MSSWEGWARTPYGGYLLSKACFSMRSHCLCPLDIHVDTALGWTSGEASVSGSRLVEPSELTYSARFRRAPFDGPKNETLSW